MAAHNKTYSLPSQPLSLSPISMVDVFFPGFTNISAALQQLQAGKSNGYASMLCICGTLVLLGRYAYNYLRGFVVAYFTSRVYVSYSNEARDMLVTWISSQPFAHKAGSCLASVGAGRDFTNGHSDGHEKKPLQFTPWNGSFSFWYKNHRLTFHCVQKEASIFPKEEISVSCVGRSPEILRELFSECRAEYLKLIKNKTSIFEHRDRDWKKTRAIDVRQLDTVILDETKKTVLLKDIRSFLDPQARTWYSRRGIPYRRGYLLHGPPGTGKSSLSLSIAGGCDLDIYILNLSSVDNSSLGELFTNLPARCVILLEDIDAVDATQSRQRETVKVSQDETSSSTKEQPRGRVSLSVLLNVLDGVGSQEGRVLIMTTNHVERLDAALTRPGRVDRKLELGLTNKDINTRLFSAIFIHEDTSKHTRAKDGDDVNLSGMKEKTKLRTLATEFANKVPEQEFSPAEIQSFLLEYRESPHIAVENVQLWVDKTREAKMKTKRADS